MSFNVNATYFVPLHTMRGYGFVKLIDVNEEPHIIECSLKPYNIDGFKYKLYAEPIDPALREVCETRQFYTSDFEDMLKSGHIIQKTNEDMHVEIQECLEPIAGCAYIYHCREAVVEGV